MSKQKFQIGDSVVFRQNPFDDQIEEERARYNTLREKIQKVTDIKDVTKSKGTTGYWIKTDQYSDWIDQYWFRKSDTH